MPTILTLICQNCKLNFQRTLREQNRRIKDGAGKRTFCSNKCYTEFSSRPKILNNCKLCGEETTNTLFCSRVCSIIFNNHNKPKRKIKIKFCECGEQIRPTRKYCKKCFQEKFSVDWDTRTLTECKNIAGSRNSYSGMVRQNARQIAKEAGKLKKCFFCPYSNFVHAHHIKEVSSFPETALVKEVNDINNLIGVCPNCHTDIHLGIRKL